MRRPHDLRHTCTTLLIAQRSREKAFPEIVIRSSVRAGPHGIVSKSTKAPKDIPHSLRS